jgi:hypothetical protein
LPYEIVAGVPARHLSWRFDEKLRRRLEKIEWWNFPTEIIEKYIDLFDLDVSVSLIEELEKIKKNLV